MVEHLLLEAADADVPPAGGGTSLAARKGMRAAPLPRCTVTGVTAVVSVPRVLGVPAAQPAAASVGARLPLNPEPHRSTSYSDPNVAEHNYCWIAGWPRPQVKKLNDLSQLNSGMRT